MDVLTIIIMIVLFILAMLFVFSTALLTPYIGKKKFNIRNIIGFNCRFSLRSVFAHANSGGYT